jgi:hypothetical protein
MSALKGWDMRYGSRRIVVCALALSAMMAAPALAQSTRGEWLALRTRKQARHHRLPAVSTRPGAFSITAIRFFSDASGFLVGVGEARNATTSDLSYSRINFRFRNASGAELGREWTYLHGGVNARILGNNAYETLLLPGATGFFKIWTTIPAAAMKSYTVESAGEALAYAKPNATLGSAGWRPDRWAPLVYASLRPDQPLTEPRISSIVFNDDPVGPNCPCGHPSVFASSVQVSVAAYQGGVITDVQSVTAVGPHRTFQCSAPQKTGMSLHETATFTIDFSRAVDSIGRHAVEWDENEAPVTVSPISLSFDELGGQRSFTVDRWCGGTPVSSAPWFRVIEAGPSGQGAGRVTVSVEPNTGTLFRHADVSLPGVTVGVSQASACPVFSPKTVFLSAGRVTGAPVVDVRSSCLFGSELSSNADWLEFAINFGEKLQVWAEPNLTGTTRTAVVTLGRQSITIHQRPASRSLDFDNDGHLDLLWHHRTEGWVAAWQMNGMQMTAGTLLSRSQVADLDWTPVAAADLDRNATTDIVWQGQAANRLALWRMVGTDVVHEDDLLPSPESPQWTLRASSDFNQDGDPDFVWQHQGTGQIEIWYMRSGSVPSPFFPEPDWGPPERLGVVPLGPGLVADVNWTIVGAGDFNRDGWPDLVWQHEGDGRIAVWKMRGSTLVEGGLTSPGQVDDLDWKIRAVGDLNGDDQPDLIWQHRADGRVAVWLMNGTEQLRGIVIHQVPDTAWEIVGPR